MADVDVEEVQDSPVAPDGPAVASEEIGVSPKKRARRSSTGQTPKTVATVGAVAELFQLKKGDLVTVAGFIMEMYDTKEVKGRHVMTAAFGDRSAVVQLNVWTPLLEKIEKDLRARYESTPDSFPGVKLVNFEIVPLGLGSESKPVVKLQSTRQSQVQVLNGAVVIMNPDASVVTSDFGNVGAVGEVLNLRGIVQEVGPIEYSKADKAMKSFKLVDQQGRALPMKQHGEGALEEGIQELAEVIVWSAMGREGLTHPSREADEENGAYWLFSENYVLVIKEQAQKVEIKEVRIVA